MTFSLFNKKIKINWGHGHCQCIVNHSSQLSSSQMSCRRFDYVFIAEDADHRQAFSYSSYFCCENFSRISLRLCEPGAVSSSIAKVCSELFSAFAFLPPIIIPMEHPSNKPVNSDNRFFTCLNCFRRGIKNFAKVYQTGS